MKRTLITLITVFYLLVACTAKPKTQLPENTPTPTSKEHSTPIPTATTSLSPTPTPYQKPEMVSPVEAKELLLELYETNGGCELPCWWGITPGETTLEEAFDMLLPIGYLFGPGKYKELLVYSITIDVPKDFGYFSRFSVDLRTPSDESDPYYGIVTQISIYDAFTKPYSDYTLADYLNLFGEPDQVYVEIHYQLVFFNLYYLEKGIVIYSQQNENKLSAQYENKLWKESEFLSCPQYPVTWHWIFWNPHTVILENMLDATINWEVGYPLEEVTELTIHEFYEIYLDPNTNYCVEGKGGTEY